MSAHSENEEMTCPFYIILAVGAGLLQWLHHGVKNLMNMAPWVLECTSSQSKRWDIDGTLLSVRLTRTVQTENHL